MKHWDGYVHSHIMNMPAENTHELTPAKECTAFILTVSLQNVENWVKSWHFRMNARMFVLTSGISYL